MLVPCVITTGSIEDCVCERLAQLAERGIPSQTEYLCRSIVFAILIFFSLTRYLETGCSESDGTWQWGLPPPNICGDDLH